jgi:hypothetical protein
MPLVHVVNENSHPYKEKFNDNLVQIPAGGRITMDSDEARRFLGKCNGVMKDGGGQPDPRGFKRLRIETLASEATALAPEAETFISQMTGEQFKTQADLDAHLEKYKDRIVVDESAERQIKARKAKTA